MRNAKERTDSGVPRSWRSSDEPHVQAGWIYKRISWIPLLAILSLPAWSQDITGDLNTSISGSTVDSNNSTDTTNYNGAGSAPFSTPVPTAAAPTVMGGGGNDSCLIPKQQAFQISIFGRAEGSMEQDNECNRRKDARLIGTPQEVGGLGLQVSGISVMCSNPEVFRAMALASTPCPIYSLTTGKLMIGREAYVAMRDDPRIYVVGYERDTSFWNTFLLIGEELPDVQVSQDTGPSLSERFRRSSGNGRSDNNEPRSVGTDHPRPD